MFRIHDCVVGIMLILDGFNMVPASARARKAFTGLNNLGVGLAACLMISAVGCGTGTGHVDQSAAVGVHDPQPVEPNGLPALPKYDYSIFDGSKHGIYSTDLNDRSGFGNPFSGFTAIGDTGQIERIIDLRGFIPFSFPSRERGKKQGQSPLNWFMDIFQWYMCPTPDGVGRLYYGFDNSHIGNMRNIPLVPEAHAKGEDLAWAKLAYRLATDNGDALYERVGGGSHPLASEPIVVFFNKSSAFVVINFRYQSMEREGTGQYLVAFEFSRSLREYRMFHAIHHNYAFSPRISQAFSDSLPIIRAVLSTVFR